MGNQVSTQANLKPSPENIQNMGNKSPTEKAADQTGQDASKSTFYVEVCQTYLFYFPITDVKKHRHAINLNPWFISNLVPKRDHIFGTS